MIAAGRVGRQLAVVNPGFPNGPVSWVEGSRRHAPVFTPRDPSVGAAKWTAGRTASVKAPSRAIPCVPRSVSAKAPSRAVPCTLRSTSVNAPFRVLTGLWWTEPPTARLPGYAGRGVDHAPGTRREPFTSTPMGVNSIPFGSPHVRLMGVHRTCGEPNEIK